MTAPRRLPVVLLWHMHQPQYRDALTGQYLLPWTYLHAIKDYTDMAAHLEAHPEARAVVNFTPILLEQLDDLAQGIARHLERGDPLPDPVLALLGSAALPEGGAARAEVIRSCLRAQRHHMIERFPPYLELAGLAETLATDDRAAYASDRLIRDLAVWYHLAWMGESVRRSDVRIAALAEQGRDFTVRQRRELLALVGELIGGVIPRFRKLREAGRCEVSVSPYSHPIVPLLIDFRAARESVPDAPLPRHAGYPGGAERADWQVVEAIRVFTRYFGAPPAGCWPSEGAVSAATLRLLEARGLRWAASSGNVLRASLAPSAAHAEGAHAEGARADGAHAEGAHADGAHAGSAAGTGTASAAAGLHDRPYRPYCLREGKLACFFRDDRLSDLIGFTYATWHGDDAARNLIHELTAIATTGSDCAVLIALDGENAWEHYPFNGYYFLDALYAGLAAEPSLELVTLSECLARGLEPLPLARLTAGSWVHGTLSTWMGDADKNAAWDLLCEAKQVFDETVGRGELEGERRAAAERQLALCEGSDWFWWLGDYNPRESVRQFDELYRRQLRVLYRLLGRPEPSSLGQPLSAGAADLERDAKPQDAEHGGVMRRAFAS